MKTKISKKNVFVKYLVIIAVMLLSITAMTMTFDVENVKADSIAPSSDLVFTLFTNEQGESEYKVSLKSTSRPLVETVVIPQFYNDLPVTQIADSGFMASTKLEKVILPTSIVKLGMNAFMGCSKLKLVTMSRVEVISANAFAMCPALENLYFPKSLKSVGATILRNNAQKIYLQMYLPNSTQTSETVWDPSWQSYFTGEIEEGVEPQDLLTYRPIYDKPASDPTAEIIGYELPENQLIQGYEDITIYSSYSPEPENVEYKPILNICPNAFAMSYGKSLTIKHRHTEDDSFETFDHAINIRSNAFEMSAIDEISIETDVTFIHPEGLENAGFSMIDGAAIEGDENNNSVKVFNWAYATTSITLPSTIDIIPERMFSNCIALEQINVFGTEYSGENRLPNVDTIGSYAFEGCGALENIYIPSSVLNMGESIFYLWGESALEQSIHIDRYANELPAYNAGTQMGWNSEWNEGITTSPNFYGGFATINYKQLITITLDLQGGSSTTTEIQVAPGQNLPSIAMPTRTGYIFKGFYSGQNATGLQYYTADMEPVRTWSESNDPILYASWQRKVYTVTLSTGFSTSLIYPEFDTAMPASTKPQCVGYEFGGYYYLESNGTKTY